MIRRAKKEDAKVIGNLIKRSWQIAYKDLIDQNSLNSMQEDILIKNWEECILSQNEQNNIFVYEENSKILGVIRFGSLNDDKYNAEIYVLYVEPEVKRQGIGTKLFKYAKEILIKNNKAHLIVWCLKGNEPSIDFYKKMGGIISTERTATVNNIKLEEVGMEYNLDKLRLVKSTKEHES